MQSRCGRGSMMCSMASIVIAPSSIAQFEADAHDLRQILMHKSLAVVETKQPKQSYSSSVCRTG